MALYPCSIDGARYRGPQATMYPAIVHGAESRRSHLRLCRPHFQELEDYCRSHLQEVIYDQPEPPETDRPACAICGGDVPGNMLAFVTAYPQGSSEVQYYGKLCDSCVSGFGTHMHIPK